MNKKIFILALIPILIFTLSACSRGEEESGKLIIMEHVDEDGNEAQIYFEGIDEETEERIYSATVGPREGFLFAGWFKTDNYEILISSAYSFEIRIPFGEAPPAYYPLFIRDEDNPKESEDKVALTIFLNNRTIIRNIDRYSTMNQNNLEYPDLEENSPFFKYFVDEEGEMFFTFDEIKENTVIYAQYSDEEPVVRFYNNGDLLVYQYYQTQSMPFHSLNIPDVEAPEGKELLGWMNILGQEVDKDFIIESNQSFFPIFGVPVEEVEEKDEKPVEDDDEEYEEEPEEEIIPERTLTIHLTKEEAIEKTFPKDESITEQSWFVNYQNINKGAGYDFIGWSTKGFGNSPDFTNLGEVGDVDAVYAIHTITVLIEPLSGPTVRVRDIILHTTLQDNYDKFPVLPSNETRTFVGYATFERPRAPENPNSIVFDSAFPRLYGASVNPRYAHPTYEIIFHFRDQHGQTILSRVGREHYSFRGSGIDFPELDLERGQIVAYWYYYRNGERLMVDKNSNISNFNGRSITLYPKIDYERIEVSLDGQTLNFPKGLSFYESEYSLPKEKNGNLIVWFSGSQIITPHTRINGNLSLQYRNARVNEKTNIVFELNNGFIEKDILKGTSLEDNFDILPEMSVPENKVFKGWSTPSGDILKWNEIINENLILRPVFVEKEEGFVIINIENKIQLQIERRTSLLSQGEYLPRLSSNNVDGMLRIVNNSNNDEFSISSNIPLDRDLRVEEPISLVRLRLYDYHGDIRTEIYLTRGSDYPSGNFLPALEVVNGRIHLGWFDNPNTSQGRRMNKVYNINSNLDLFPLYKRENNNTHENYHYNLGLGKPQNIFNVGGFIYNQGTVPYRESRRASSDVGCGWVAVYNALHELRAQGLFNQEINIADIIRFFENDYEFLWTGGKMPGGIVQYFRELGFEANHYHTNILERVRQSDVSILLNVTPHHFTGHYQMIHHHNKDGVYELYNSYLTEETSWSGIKSHFDLSYFTVITINAK